MKAVHTPDPGRGAVTDHGVPADHEGRGVRALLDSQLRSGVDVHVPKQTNEDAVPYACGHATTRDAQLAGYGHGEGMGREGNEIHTRVLPLRALPVTATHRYLWTDRN